MKSVFIKILNMSITASWLVLAVILLRFVLKKVPKTIQCILWGFVGFRLVCPFSFESILSLIPSAETIPSDIIYSQSPAIESGIPAVNNAINPIITDNLTTDVGASVSSLQLITFVASIIWVIGVAVMIFYSIFSYLKLSRKTSASINYKDNIYYCDNISSPFILGIIKPRIYLPSSISSKQIEYVVAHENAHIKRRDHWWKPFGFALLSVYWFNPLIWIAYILLCKDIEMACDEAVIKKADIEYKKGYSTALVECSFPQRKMIMSCPLAFGEVGVKQRIKSILNYKRPGFWVVLLAVTSGVAIALLFMTNPVVKVSNNNPVEVSRKTSQFYTLNYDEKNFTYTYEIRDKFGNTLLADKNYRGSVSIIAVNDSVIKRHISCGVGSAAQADTYCDINSGRVSKTYFGVLAEYKNNVIYWERENFDGKNVRLIVRDFFDKEKFYKNVFLGYSPAAAEPISEVKIKDNKIEFIFLGQNSQNKIQVDLTSTDNSYDVITTNKCTTVNGYFSYEEDIKYWKSLYTKNLKNTTPQEINNADEALALAKKEVTIPYNQTKIYWDEENDFWKICFFTKNTLGGVQTVYLDSNGITLGCIYGK